VKRLSADDSADSRVKVGHRQALTAKNSPVDLMIDWAFSFCIRQLFEKLLNKLFRYWFESDI
jgi:hypothetical protein